jgi:hypothetical protein
MIMSTMIPTEATQPEDNRVGVLARAENEPAKITKSSNSVAWSMIFSGIAFVFIGLILLGSRNQFTDTPSLGGLITLGIGAQLVILGWLAFAIRQK